MWVGARELGRERWERKLDTRINFFRLKTLGIEASVVT